jgi:hypothetical protein
MLLLLPTRHGTGWMYERYQIRLFRKGMDGDPKYGTSEYDYTFHSLCPEYYYCICTMVIATALRLECYS